jgi:3-oxoadipate enol-lactonase
MSEFFVDLPDRQVTICADRAGDGPPLVVLNGTASDLRNAPNALAWPIAEHFDVLTFDHRCLGRSEQHDPDHQPSMVDFADDVVALCDQQGIDEFAVLGISFGGMVAQELAISAGSRVSRMVLACTSSGGAGGASYPLHKGPPNGTSFDLALWDSRVGTNDAVTKLITRLYGHRDRPSTPPPGLVQQLTARAQHDTFDRLGQITPPTLVAYGQFDGVAPPSNSEAIAEHIPNSMLAAFDGGHPFLWQDRSAWPVLIEFLRA